MKRIGYIYPKICDKENIKNAILKASKNKRNRKSVKRCLDNIDLCVDKIFDLLSNKSYSPTPTRKKTIKDGITQKERIISIPSFFPDQIIQWAILLQIKPILERGMYELSCASIPNKGGLYAKRHVEKWIRSDFKNTKYCLKIDIKKFYPSINHDCLKAKLRRKIKDKDVLLLLDKMIDSEDGLPIGSVLSQWLANFYLQDTDHYIKENLKVKYYVRYMDDMVLFGGNKKKIRLIFQQLQSEINKHKLTVKGNWQIFRTDSRGIDFVGYRMYRNKTILRKSTMLRMSRKVARTYKSNKWNPHNCMSILSYLGRIKWCNTYNFYQKWIKPKINIKKMKGVVRYYYDNSHKKNTF